MRGENEIRAAPQICAYRTLHLPGSLESLEYKGLETSGVWAVCNTATQIYLLRFFVGLAESGFYLEPYVIGSWYRRAEFSNRFYIFHTNSALGIGPCSPSN